MVTKWRPTLSGCLYVIPDVHGMIYQLELICDRIFPLRHTGGVKDKLIFLGDYIDRRGTSPDVLDLLIELKDKYKDQIVFLRGNHEDMFMDAVHLGSAFPSKFDFWYVNGGIETLVGYLKRANRNEHLSEPHRFPRQRLKDIIPKAHLNFLENELQDYYEDDNFIFVHAGCDPAIPLISQNPSILWWDRSLYGFVKRVRSPSFRRVDESSVVELPWSKTIVTGHNSDETGRPYVQDKYMMLDCSYRNILLVMEMNSRNIFKSQLGVSRLVRIDIPEKMSMKGAV
jgi:serine/threonine protein phosphatase 1